jgi:hypothetical protein
MHFFVVCMSGHADYPYITIQQSKAWKPGTTYRKKYGVVVEIVMPGIDGIPYFKAPMPDDVFNNMCAWIHENQLKPVSAQELHDAVLVLKPMITSLIVEKNDGFWQVIPNQWTFYKNPPEFDWGRSRRQQGRRMRQRGHPNRSRLPRSRGWRGPAAPSGASEDYCT